MPLSYHRRLQAQLLLSGLPGLLAGGWAAHAAGWPAWAQGIFLTGTGGALVWGARRLGEHAQRPLQTLANLLGALREGDFSFRARELGHEDALGQVYAELNTLSELLQQQRLRTMEATALLREVMAEIDVGIFAFDAEHRLRLVNRAGAGLLGSAPERLQGEPAGTLGLAAALEGESPTLADLAMPGRSGRFEVRRTQFRQGGHPMHLLVLSDLTRTLREEERRTWQRLVRVLGHEINNSLAPIQSLAESLVRIMEAQGEDWMEDARQGLGIIGNRAQGLGTFMSAYTRLARLPEPTPRPADLGALVRRVAALETRGSVRIDPGPSLRLPMDETQMEQALINLVKNAVEASLERSGAVTLTWRLGDREAEILILDEGPGLPEDGNLFVPFFTTKPGGSGIGLVFSRQIVENHGGSLTLRNRPDSRGAEALVRLPVSRAHTPSPTGA